MNSNEDYLDELLKSMGEDGDNETTFTKGVSSIMDNGMMDQAMIDALLAGAAGNAVAEELKAEEVSIEEAQVFDSPEDFERA